ncbi:MAG: TolC family protein, partial [Terracidiphilus sp.]
MFLQRISTLLAATSLLMANGSLAVEPAVTASAQTTLTAGTPAPRNIPFDQLLRPSRNPINAYRGIAVAPPSLVNSTRLSSLVRDGKLYLSLRNAIDLALENNLDLVIARYNIPIAQMDVQRTRAGGSVRG